MNIKESNNIILKSIISIIVAFLLYSISDAVLKNLTSKLNVFQITLFHALVTFVISFIYAIAKYKLSLFKTTHYKTYIFYGIFAGGVAFANIYGFSKLRLDQFYTIVFTAPLWIILLSRLILKESIDKKTLIATSIGFLVILIVMRPSGDLFNLGALATSFGTIFFSLGTILAKKVKADKKSKFLLVMSASLFVTLISTILLKGNISDISSGWSYLFLASGGFSFLGAMFLLYAFQVSPASYIVAPFHYTQIIWGIILGYLLFDDKPTIDTILGSSVLIVIGIYLIYHQIRKK